MATITDWSAGQVFTARVYKRLRQAPTVVWANTYEFASDQEVTAGAEKAISVAAAIVGYEKEFHLPFVEFDRVVVSTAQEDGKPYNPVSFVSDDFTGVYGLAAIGETQSPAPLELCLLARRSVSYGRNGRMLYRGCLKAQDIISTGGKAALEVDARAYFNGRLDYNLSDFAEALNNLGVHMVMASNLETNGDVRTVFNQSAGGVTSKKLNNRYYDRP